MVAVLEHGDHAGPAYALRIVVRGLGEPVRLELLDPVLRRFDQGRLVAELQHPSGRP